MNKFVSMLSVGLLASTAMSQACFDRAYGTSLGSTNDTVHPAQPIGFAFPMNGMTYSDIHISDHGVCWLSNGGTPTPAASGGVTYNVLLTDFVGFGPCIAPFWADANCGYAPNVLGEVWINNTDPTRLVVTWTGIWTYSNVGPQYEFQMVLHDSGVVEFLYGPNVNNYGSTFAPNAIVGITPGQGALLPAVSDLSASPVTTDPTVYEEFVAASTFDLADNGLMFTPTSPGWAVSQLGAPVGCAEVMTFGDGCTKQEGMFFEDLASGAFDLAGSTMTMLRTGNGYLCLDSIPGTVFTPSAAAVVVADGDELEETVTLSAPVAGPTGPTTDLTIESNGRITFGPVGPGPNFTPAAATLQAGGTATFAPFWHDMDSSAAGSGKITFEESGGFAYITWDNVYSFGATAGNTFQVQIELATGSITTIWTSSSAAGGNMLVGMTGGTATSVPPAVDLSTELTSTFETFDMEILPLTADANTPVLGANWDLNATNVDPLSPIAIFFFGNTQGPGLPLTVIGLNAPGCSVWIDTVLGSLTGVVSSGSASVQLPIPANTALTGVTVSCQALCLTLNNSANLLTSNGVLGTIGQ